MPYLFDAPLVAETHSMRLHRFSYDDDTKAFNVTVTHYDADGFEVKTDNITFPSVDGAGNIIMPADWPTENPTGETLYGLLKIALYGRYKEAAVITQSGVFV